MPVNISSGTLFGLEARLVMVEIDISRGLPAFSVVGLPDRALQESKERVRSALKNSNLPYPDRRITINLAPADQKKEGPQFDLAIALGLLAAQGSIPAKNLSDTFIVGELSLAGKVRAVRGVVPFLELAKAAGAKNFIFPRANREELPDIPDIKYIPVKNLAEISASLQNIKTLPSWQPTFSYEELVAQDKKRKSSGIKLEDIKGQLPAKRVLEIAAAGNHNLLFIGPPGSGKTLLARSLAELLPPLKPIEAREVALIASAAGLKSEISRQKIKRPWRDPHHSISTVGLIGGGKTVTPGEVTLAHRGVLFLDEIPEFKRDVLENLRQPLEKGVINIIRQTYNVKLAADFLLIAAMNPCPCGYQNNKDEGCRCTPYRIAEYRGRLSGPLLDRIDIHFEVPALKPEEIVYSNNGGPTTAEVQEKVLKARKRQSERQAIFSDDEVEIWNSSLDYNTLEEICQLTFRERQFLARAFKGLGLSARAFDKILRVARTIADLDNSKSVKEEHLSEALIYRPQLL